MMAKYFLTAVFLIILTSCSSSIPPVFPKASNIANCSELYAKLDQIVSDYDVEDSGEYRISDFPYLRSDRFLASFSNEQLSSSEYRQWLDLMREKDINARLLEFSNLPLNARQKILTWIPEHQSIALQLRNCSHLLSKHHQTQVSDGDITQLSLSIADNYQDWQRIIGLYPFARYFAESSIDELHREMRYPFGLDINHIQAKGKLLRYRSTETTKLNRKQVEDIFSNAYDNPLQIPQLKPNELKRLLMTFAPVWEIDTLSQSDQIGKVRLVEGDVAEVDTHIPTVYIHHSFTRFHKENLLQLIYQIWFPSRPKTNLLDLYGGELDSVIWRVTLNPQGQPIAYDSIHACGCYYLLFPASGYEIQSTLNDLEPILSPQQVQFDPYHEKLLIRISSGTHYLQKISNALTPDSALTYQIVPYNHLRSLPISDDHSVNLFGQDGIIAASSRLERFILWPFGVENPGAMRQWGSHAIAFIGKRHFDEAFLLENLITRVDHN